MDMGEWLDWACRLLFADPCFIPWSLLFSSNPCSFGCSSFLLSVILAASTLSAQLSKSHILQSSWPYGTNSQVGGQMYAMWWRVRRRQGVGDWWWSRALPEGRHKLRGCLRWCVPDRTASAKALRQQCAWPVLETTRNPEGLGCSGEGKSGGRGAGRQVRGGSRRALEVTAGLYNEWPLQGGLVWAAECHNLTHGTKDPFELLSGESV